MPFDTHGRERNLNSSELHRLCSPAPPPYAYHAYDNQPNLAPPEDGESHISRRTTAGPSVLRLSERGTHSDPDNLVNSNSDHLQLEQIDLPLLHQGHSESAAIGDLESLPQIEREVIKQWIEGRYFSLPDYGEVNQQMPDGARYESPTDLLIWCLNLWNRDFPTLALRTTLTKEKLRDVFYIKPREGTPYPWEIELKIPIDCWEDIHRTIFIPLVEYGGQLFKVKRPGSDRKDKLGFGPFTERRKRHICEREGCGTPQRLMRFEIEATWDIVPPLEELMELQQLEEHCPRPFAQFMICLRSYVPEKKWTEGCVVMKLGVTSINDYKNNWKSSVRIGQEGLRRPQDFRGQSRW